MKGDSDDMSRAWTYYIGSFSRAAAARYSAEIASAFAPEPQSPAGDDAIGNNVRWNATQ